MYPSASARIAAGGGEAEFGHRESCKFDSHGAGARQSHFVSIDPFWTLTDLKNHLYTLFGQDKSGFELKIIFKGRLVRCITNLSGCRSEAGCQVQFVEKS
jgi:hypothetical protein